MAAAVTRRRKRSAERPRALVDLDHLGRDLEALYSADAAVNAHRGSEIASGGGAPAPMRTAVVDGRAAIQRLLRYMRMIATRVLTGGESTVRPTGWWGTVLCPCCDQDTLLHDLGEQKVSCTNPDCDDDGQPWWGTERWLLGRIAALDDDSDDGPLTIEQRQRRRIAELEDRERTQADTYDTLARYAAETAAERDRLLKLLTSHGLTQPQVTAIPSTHGRHVCPESGRA